jgi:hypothetical protein
MLLAVAVVFYFHTLQTLNVTMCCTYVQFAANHLKIPPCCHVFAFRKTNDISYRHFAATKQCISVLQLCGTTVTVIKHIAKVQPGYGTIIMLTTSHVRAVKTELES